MKFELHDCWKHSNCIDAFIFVSNVVQDDNGKAILHAYWMVQGIKGYWMVSSQERLFIKDDHYANWQLYEPKGMFI